MQTFRAHVLPVQLRTLSMWNIIRVETITCSISPTWPAHSAKVLMFDHIVCCLQSYPLSMRLEADPQRETWETCCVFALMPLIRSHHTWLRAQLHFHSFSRLAVGFRGLVTCCCSLRSCSMRRTSLIWHKLFWIGSYDALIRPPHPHCYCVSACQLLFISCWREKRVFSWQVTLTKSNWTCLFKVTNLHLSMWWS